MGQRHARFPQSQPLQGLRLGRDGVREGGEVEEASQERTEQQREEDGDEMRCQLTFRLRAGGMR